MGPAGALCRALVPRWRPTPYPDLKKKRVEIYWELCQKLVFGLVVGVVVVVVSVNELKFGGVGSTPTGSCLRL